MTKADAARTRADKPAKTPKSKVAKAKPPKTKASRSDKQPVRTPVLPSLWQAWGLIAVAVAIVVATGWFAYQATQEADETLREANMASQGAPAVDQKSSASNLKLPEGYVQYDGTDLGIRFAYPQAWGEVHREKGPETAHLSAGSEWLFKFTKNSAVTAGMRSADWRHIVELGHDGAPHATNYALSGVDSFSNGSVFTVLGDQSFIVNAPLTGVGCAGVGNVLVSKLDNTAYPGIAFMYVDKQASGKYDDPICAAKTYKQYLNPQHHEELLTISKYIQAVY